MPSCGFRAFAGHSHNVRPPSPGPLCVLLSILRECRRPFRPLLPPEVPYAPENHEISGNADTFRTQ